MIMFTKLRCKNSTFTGNYQYLSYKYQLTDLDWQGDLNHLLGKVKMKAKYLYASSPHAHSVVELCCIRDNKMTCDTLCNVEICKLIESFCIA